LDRAQQVLGAEIGPHPAREDELRIGAFPQQKVAQTALGSQNGVAAGVIDGDSQP
jgi:hypothetical protein